MRDGRSISGFQAYIVIAHLAHQMGMTPVECFKDIEEKYRKVTEVIKNDRNQGSKEAGDGSSESR